MTEPNLPAAKRPFLQRDRLVLVIVMLMLTNVSAMISQVIDSGSDPANSPVAQGIWASVYAYAFFGLLAVRTRASQSLRASIPIVIIVGLALLSMLWSAEPALTAKRAFGLLGTSLIGYYIACRFRIGDFLECLVLSTIIAAVLSLVAIIAFPQIGVMQSAYAGAWSGIFGDKNRLAAAMVIGILGALLLARASGGRRRASYLLSAGLFGVLLIGSNSRTSLIVCGLLTVFSAFLTRKRRLAPPIIVAIVLCVGAAYMLLIAFGSDLQGLFGFLGRDSTLSGRTDIWPFVINAISDRPMLGWGYEAFWLPEGPSQLYITSDWTPFYSHNGFLELSLNLGLIGTGIFIVCLWSGIRGAIQLARRAPAAISVWPLVAISYYVASNLTEASIATYNSFGWVMFVCSFVYARSQGRGHANATEAVRLNLDARRALQPFSR